MGLTSRWILIVLILGWAIYAVTPISKSINLGLDLQGGMHIVLDVDTEKAIEGKIDNAVMQIRKDLDSEKMAYTFVRKQNILNIAVGIGENTDRDAVIKVIKESYDLLGLMSFLTAGEPEVRAWTIKKGTKAPEAAGKIHSDIQRGFIRAEVVSYDDLVRLGSMNEAKEKGLVRSEGKDYIMQDGDVVLFRFNV